MSFERFAVLLAMLACAACSRAPEGSAPEGHVHGATGAAAVSTERLLAADADRANWLTYGRTYDEQRFSPLALIDDQNVGDLQLAWYYDLDTAHRGQEGTQLVHHAPGD